MQAQQTNLDTISNNLANANTTAFKTQRAMFADLLYQTHSTSSLSSGTNGGTPIPVQIGLGVQWEGNMSDFTQGTLAQTNNPLNMAISGNGFFQVTGPDGNPAYTRDGTFQVNSSGLLETAQGYLLTPNVQIPPTAINVSINSAGLVTAVTPGSSAPTQVAQIQISTFANPGGLTRIGQNLYQPGGNSGEAQEVTPGTTGAGTISSGYIESSNVQVVDEMVNMITAQRAYEINSKAIQTADQMLQVANQLKSS
jgi:flagellar basal-body rod protein FlgG